MRDEATRRQIANEFERGFSPLTVTTQWQDFGDFVFEVEGFPRVRIPRAKLNWQAAMKHIAFHRRNLLRDGVALAEWEPPPEPTHS